MARGPSGRPLSGAPVEHHHHVRLRRVARALGPAHRAHPGAAEGDRRLHRVRAAPLRPHGRAHLSPAQGPPRPDLPRGVAHARRGPNRLPAVGSEHPGELGQDGCRGGPPGPDGRGQRPRWDPHGREHLPCRRSQSRSGHGRGGLPGDRRTHRAPARAANHVVRAGPGAGLSGARVAERTRRRRTGRPEIDRSIEELLDAAGAQSNRDQLFEILATAIRMASNGADRLDLKITNAAVKEMAEAFAVFAPYRSIPKLTMFGSARTRTDDPLYAQARELAANLAGAGRMLVTGAGPRIMAAGLAGA